jgi:hypothetical protein
VRQSWKWFRLAESDRPSPGPRPGEAGGSATVRLLFALAPLAFVADGVFAQDLAERLAACEGKVVSEIVVTVRDPLLPRLPSRLRWLTGAAESLHTATKAGVVERFLLLTPGEPCTERRRAESERILRLQPFLAEASVRAVPDLLGGTRIEVEATDEISPLLDVRFRGARPSFVRIGNTNVAGQGLTVLAGAERGFAYRTGLHLHATAYQVFRRPYTLTFVLDHAPLGRTRSLSLGHPFLTDLQRNAWYLGYDEVHEYPSFVRPDLAELSLEVRRRFWGLGGVRRLGIGRQSAFMGALVSHEDMAPGRQAVIVSDSGLVADTTDALGGPHPSYRNVRFNAVLGARILSFTRARGFDALLASQDIATGVQLGVLLGRGIPRLGSAANDIFASADLYAGLGAPRSFTSVRIGLEARRDVRADRWDSMVGSGRLVWYAKPADSHLVISSLEMAGGWRSRVPFQLRLGDRHGGARGYVASRDGGAVRGVGRVEHRWLVGEVADRAAFGWATFVDIGRVWAGDAPIGRDSPPRVGLGAGLLVAFPPESNRMWRLDVAIPLGSDPDARWEVRLTGTRVRPFWREPDDVARARASGSPATIFTWW